jgi:tetratricopeptide (TPR) repeat protein
VNIFAALLLCCGAFWSLRLAVAETFFRDDTPPAVKRATAMQGNAPSAEFAERLAEIEPADALIALETAVAINPRASGAWISLGLLEESSDDLAAAERSLLTAARIDHQFLPAWTLTNFYFRRGDREAFWRWAKQAASFTFDDFLPLIRLCDQFERDPTRVLSRLGEVRRLRPTYLGFLIDEKRLDAAQQVGRGMFNDHANDPYLINLADHQLGAGNTTAAIEVWNIASGFEPIDPAARRVLTNGNLARAPLNLGFDWRLGQEAGVITNWAPSQLTFELLGSEAETAMFMKQTLSAVPDHWRLRFDYVTRGALSPGIRWLLNEKEGPLIEPSDQWRTGDFPLPRTRGSGELKLIYRREPGTTRATGRIEIRNLRLEASL